MHYEISPGQRKYEIEIIATFSPQRLAKHLELILPDWRPGRYELANFAKNILSFKVTNEKTEILNFRKTEKNKWQVDVSASQKVFIHYTYYAIDLNAGSSYYDGEQLYLNPVNILLYVPGSEDQPCSLQLMIPEAFKVSSSLNFTKGLSHPTSLHELFDSPIICASQLETHQFKCENHSFFIDIIGNHQLSIEKMILDFSHFIKIQKLMMGSFPFESYRFMFQFTSYRHYHGVEHLNSTVIVLGPNNLIHEEGLYKELMGVSSHELFHSWCVKSFRPIELVPYDYSQENYTELGYLMEGATTYYGDLFLFRSGFFSDEDYFHELSQMLQKHKDNGGRFNKSLAESSIDLWVDGYNNEVPHRKVSIYNEGALFFFCLDFLIRKNSNNSYSLDDVMRELFLKFKAVEEKDLISLAEKFSGKEMKSIFQECIHKAYDYSNTFQEACQYFGLNIQETTSENLMKSRLGIKINLKRIVTTTAFKGPAYLNGILPGDFIVSINNLEFNDENFEKLNEVLFNADQVEIKIKRKSIEQCVLVCFSKKDLGFNDYVITKSHNSDNKQQVAFELWKNLPISQT